MAEIVITGISLTVDTSSVTTAKEERTLRYSVPRSQQSSASAYSKRATSKTDVETKKLSRAKNAASIVAKVQHQKELSRDVNSLALDEIPAECDLERNQEYLDSPTEVSVRTATRKIHPSRPREQVSHL